MIDDDDIALNNLYQHCAAVDSQIFNNESGSFSGSGLGILHLNINSCNANFDTFIAHLDILKFKFAVIILTEIYTTEANDIYHIDGYDEYNLYRSDSRGGGIKFFVLRSLKSRRCFSLDVIDNVFESITINLNVSTTCSFHITAVYRCHTSTIHAFNQSFSDRILAKFQPNDKHLLIGDFNINLFNPDSDAAIENFYSLMFNNNLLPIINKPTRVTPQSSTLIDHIWTNISFPSNSYVFQWQISDHFPIATVFPATALKEKVKVTFRDYSHPNIQSFTNHMATHLPNYAIDGTDPDLDVTSFATWLSTKIDNFFPTRTKEINLLKTKNPWLTKEIKALIKKKYLIYKNYKNNLISYSEFKRYRNLLNKLIRAVKFNYLKNSFSLARNNIKATWCLINTTLGLRKSTKVNSLKVNDQLIDDTYTISQTFNNYFITTPMNVYSQIPNPVNDHDHRLRLNPCSAFFSDSTPFEVFTCITGLKKKNSAIDNITTKILKLISAPISSPLAALFNNCLAAGIFPSLLKQAKVIPVYKKGSGCTTDMSNYRPISILHTISKIFEKLTYSRILCFLNQYNLLSTTQYGFTKNCSTQHATIHLLSYILPSFTLKQFNISIFIDFSKAFDTIVHTRLLNKLWNYGFRGIVHSFMKSYLENRSQYVSISDTASQCLKNKHGVPQGSCLGPLLFNIYVNDMALLPITAHMVQFADDTVFTYTSPSIEHLETVLNSDLSIIADWCFANKLALNIRKTKAMLFTTRQNPTFPRLHINNSDVEFVNVYKYLGIKIDNKLKFDEHINSLKGKLARVVGMTFALGRVIDVTIARSIYFSLAYSHITYLISIWGHSGLTRIEDVQVQQNKIVRNLFRHRSPQLSTSELYARYNLLKIKDIYTLEIGKMMFSALHTNKYPLLKQHLDALHWTHNHNTRKVSIYRLPFARILPDYNSFLFQAVKSWNGFPLHVRNSISLPQLKRELSKHLLSSY